MARKSRKHLFGNKPSDYNINDKVQINKLKIYNTAAYAHLSVINDDNSESIENQIEIIKEFISKNHDLILSEIYVDKGKKGMDFNRPEFIRLTEDVKAGKIDCIVVKDLSRFGRNFIETGNYIERIFPYLDVRFISIADDFDTKYHNNEMLTIAFKNLINDFYARDISEKIKSALLSKQLEGKYLGGLAPYGYKRDPKDKYKLIPDEEAALTGKRIFKMKAECKSYTEIARQINSENIISPFAYNKGKICEADVKNKFWSDCTIRSILTNCVYICHHISKKTKRTLFSSRKRVKTGESEFVIFKNAYKPIVDKDIFNKVQKIISEEQKQSKKRGERINAENLFKNLIYCGICGKKMDLRSRRRGENIYSVYSCYNHRLYGNISCKNKSNINYNYVKSVVYHFIKNIFEIYISDESFNNLEFELPENVFEKEAAIMNTTNDIYEIKNRKLLLFEKYANNFISQYEYSAESKKISLLEEKLIKKLDFLSDLSDNLLRIKRDKFYNFTENDLNIKVVECFVNRIKYLKKTKLK